MSMLTAQVDRLRETAHEVKRIKNDNVDWLWRNAITLEDAVKEMREAADTIENLRNRLTENQMCQIELDWDYDEPPQARWWRCHGCGERFVYQRGLNPTYCPECGLQRVVE